MRGKAFVLPVVLAVVLVVSCSKTQAPVTPDAVDQAKLSKEKLDTKFMRLALTGAFKKQLFLKLLPDSVSKHLEFKQKLELFLQVAEGDEAKKYSIQSR